MFYNDLVTLLTSLVNVGMFGFLWYIHHSYYDSKLRAMKDSMIDRVDYVENRVIRVTRSLERRIERLEDETGLGGIVDKDDLATPEQNIGIVVNYNTPSEYTYQGGDVVGLINLPNRQTSPKLQDEGK